MQVKFNSKYAGEINGTFTVNTYKNNGNTSVHLLEIDEGPFATLSVNIDLKLPPDEFVAKTYSENEGLVEQFIEMGYFEPTGGKIQVGYAGYMPVLRFTEKFKKEVGVS